MRSDENNEMQGEMRGRMKGMDAAKRREEEGMMSDLGDGKPRMPSRKMEDGSDPSEHNAGGRGISG